MKAEDSIKLRWDPRFTDRSAAFAAFAELAKPLRNRPAWPDLELLQQLCEARAIANAQGMPLRLTGTRSAESYEARIYLRAEMHVRAGDWHDLFNVLSWLAYPRTKAALNQRHYADMTGAAGGEANRTRSRVRDALTLFDESGAIVVSSDAELLDHVRAFRWKELFRTRRSRVVECMRVFMFGHALAQKLLAPYVGITAHALLFAVDDTFVHAPLPRQVEEIDRLGASALADASALETPQRLAPLPVLGIPGWYPANESAAFYDNADYFRPARGSRPS